MIDARPVRHYGQPILAVVLLFLLAGVLNSVWRSPNIDHPTIAQFLTSPAILSGLATTLRLTVISGAVGLVLGVVFAVLRSSRNRVLAALSWLYIWLFRGTPLLAQILIWGNLALLFENLVIGIPFTDITFFTAPTNVVVTAFVASVLGLGLNEGAYMAEVVRGGILAVDKGQAEAAKALGMTQAQTMRRIVLPQALRVIIPPTANQLINLLKASSLVSVIAGGDLLTQAHIISAANLRTIELLFVASFWYLVIVSVASVAQYFLERRLGRGR
ncbi:amino acid ABC transporter permease [Pseudonocardia acaciae]|uniref:amino acid ABC transporter permease n=1 Tax=Pseudonocardia acaciae TaxID=551276 RepID=UPI000A6D1573|nr:amino acid ABC transporter permease [Pseudonocardia acaciae]